MALMYPTGEVAQAKDVVLYAGLRAQVELVVSSAGETPEGAWFHSQFGPGILVAEPTVFGRVYVESGDFADDVVFVERG